MARLNQIEIRESELTYTNQRDWFFRPTGHHVCELLLHYIGRDFILDGSSKFSATFGQRPDYDEPFHTVLGVTSYYVEDFDVANHMTRPIEEQQEAILTELVNVMTHAARSAGSDPDVISNAAAEVRNRDFSSEISVEKLWKSTKDRKLRVQVYRCLGPWIGEVWEARVCARDGTVLGIEPITDNPSSLDRTDQFSKSSWSGDIFQITSTRLTTIEYSLDISPYTGNMSDEAVHGRTKKHAELQHQRALSSAVSDAEKAFRAKNYDLVVCLLSPFDGELEKLAAARLAFARKKQNNA